MGHSMRRSSLRSWRSGGIVLGLCLCLGTALWAPTQAAEQDPAKEKISLDLVDADLRDAVNLIFKDTKLNVVIADGVYGTGVTLKLDNVEREKALQLLLSSKGCAFTREGGVYMIKPKPGAQNNMMIPGGAPGMMPGAEMPQVPGATMGAAPTPGGAAPTTVASARQSLPEKIALRYIDAREVMYGLAGGNAGQYGGLGGGGFGGNSSFGGGGGFGGGNSFGGGFGGGNSFGGGSSFGGGGFGGSSLGGGNSSFGSSGNNSFNSGRQVFRPTLR